LAAAVAAAIFAVGLTAVASPRFASVQYGIRTVDPAALAAFRAAGARDIVLGLLIAWFAWTQAREALAVTILFASLFAAADFLIVLRARTYKRRNLALHGFGALGLIVVWAALRAGV
jgi:hypothetical protein